MKIDLQAAIAEALATWRRDRRIIAAVAGVFFVLPAMAVLLLLPTIGAGEPVDAAEAVQLLARYAAEHAHWLFAQMLLELFGAGVLLALLLDPARPTVGEALAAAARRMPALVAAWLLLAAAKYAGGLLLLVPGFYVIGRVFVVLPVLMAEPRRRLADAVAHGVTLTAGLGFALFGVSALLFLAGQFAGLLAGSIGALAARGGGAAGAAIAALLSAVVGAGMSVAFALVRASVYRRLAASSRG